MSSKCLQLLLVLLEDTISAQRDSQSRNQVLLDHFLNCFSNLDHSVSGIDEIMFPKTHHRYSYTSRQPDTSG